MPILHVGNKAPYGPAIRKGKTAKEKNNSGKSSMAAWRYQSRSVPSHCTPRDLMSLFIVNLKRI